MWMPLFNVEWRAPERTTTYKIRKVFEHPDIEECLPREPMPVLTPAASHAPLMAIGY